MGRREDRKRLIEAIRAGALADVVAQLDADPTLADAANSHGNAPLGEAISTARLDLVQVLIERGADVGRANDGGWTMMDTAAESGSVEIARLLVEHGLTIEARHAAELGDVAMLEALLDARPEAIDDRDRRGGTPLHAAARGRRSDAVRLLLDRGADVNAPNRHGVVPLGDAVEVDAIDVAELLLDRGADPDGRAGHFVGTALHRAIVRKSEAMTKLLLERGADPNRQDYAGKTALHEAVVAGRIGLVELVLAKDPDLSLQTRACETQPGGETALDYARRRKKATIAKKIEAASGG